MRIGKHLHLKTWLIFLMMLPAWATAAKVYQWKDKDGVVHFGDQPQYSDVKKIDVNASVPDDRYYQDRVKQRSQVIKTYDAQQSAQALKEQENSSEAARKKIRCERAEKLRVSYSKATQLYSKDASGKKVMLSDEKKQAAMQEVSRYIAKWCK